MADKGIEIATAYVSLTVSARGIKGQIERELGGPIEAVSATAAAKAAANLESGLGAVDGVAIGSTIGAGIGTGIETSASAAAVATRYTFEEQLGAVDTGVLAGAIAGADMPAAGAAVGAATASAIDSGLGNAGAGAVASFERNFTGPAVSGASEAGVQVGNAFTRALDDATAIGYRKLSRVGNVLLTTAAVGAGASALLANSASKFVETQNRANVVLGRDGAEAAEKFATSALKTAGLSRQEALATQSLFAVFGKGAGLKGTALDEFDRSLTQLGGDLASFYDTSTAQASAAIQSGLEGQVRPLRQYGVLLDDARLKQRAMTLGVYDGTGVLSQQARVLAVQAEVMAQTKDAQGDFIRTSGSLANQQRVLKAEFQNTAETIGRDLMPAALATVHGFQAVLGVIDKLPAPIRETGVEVLALAVGASALGGVLAKLGSGYSFLSTIGERLAKAREATSAAGPSLEAGSATAAVEPNQALAVSQTEVAQSGDAIVGSETAAAGAIELEGTAAAGAAVETTALAGAQDLAAASGERASRFSGLFASRSSQAVAGIALATEALWAYNYAVEESAKQRTAGTKALNEDALGIQAAFDPKATDHLVKYRTELDLISGRIHTLLTDGNATTPLTGLGQKLDFIGQYSGSEQQSKDRVALIKGQLSALQGSLDGLNPEGLNTARHFLNDLNTELRGTGLTATQVTAILGPTSAKLDGLEAAAEAAGHGVDDASVSLDKAGTSLDEIKGKLTLARVGYDSATAGAKAFSDEMDRQSSLDNRLQGALGVSSARASFIGQLGNLPKDIDPDRIALGGTGTVSKLKGVETGLDAVDRALGKINEDQKLNSLQWDAMQAGAKGFSDSLARSSTLNSLLSGALGISDAVTAFRQGLDHLPATVDINNIISTSFTDPLPAKGGSGKSGWNWPDGQRPAAAKDDGSATKSLQAVLALSSATREYLSTIVGQGDYAAARANADLLRTSYEKQLATVGITGTAAQKYIEILGLTPKQIETAIKVSGADEARFKVESLLSLYRDQLPAKLATQIGLEIGSGDLDKAAADLATFAKSGERVSKDVGKSQNDSLQTVLALGAATKSYLADLVAAGTPAAKIREEAAKFRDDYTKQLASVGIVGEAAKKYLDVLGVSETAVDTSIKVSGDEIATSKIKAYIELLKDKIPTDVATRIAAAIADGDLPAAEKELDDFIAKTRTVDLTVDVKNKQQLVDLVKNIFGLGLFGTPQQPTAPTGGVGGGATAPNRPGFTSDTPAHQPLAPLAPLPPPVPFRDSAKMGLPTPGSQSGAPQRPADKTEAVGKNGTKYRFDARLNQWIPHYAAGGLVDRWNDFIGAGHVPGTGNTDSVRAMLMPREYVSTTAAVAKYGVATYEAMNRLELDPGVLAAAVRGVSVGSWVEPKKYATGGLVGDGGSWAPSWSQPDAPSMPAPAMVAELPARRGGLSDRPYEPHYHFEGRPDENTLASATARGIRDGEHLVGF